MGKRLEIVVPKTLNEITVGQYQNYATLSEGIEEQGRLGEIAIMCFCNVSLEHLRLLSSYQVNDISNRLFGVISEFTKDQPLVRKFTLKGQEYGFIPNLDKITYGENKDIISHIQAGTGSIHKAMAVLFRPIKKPGKNYSIEEYKVPVNHQKLFKDMPLNVMIGAQVFFWTLIKELLSHIPNYLQSQMEEMGYKELIQKVSTKQTGDGMMSFTA